MQAIQFVCNALKQCNLDLGVQVEFNKAALSLSDSISADQKKAALNRLLKVRPHAHVHACWRHVTIYIYLARLLEHLHTKLVLTMHPDTCKHGHFTEHLSSRQTSDIMFC